MKKHTKYPLGKKRIYSPHFENRQDVVLWDVINIKNEQILTVKFISTDSENIQGVRLAVDYGNGEIEINGIKSPGFELWEDTVPCDEYIRAVVNSEFGRVSVYNIWRNNALNNGFSQSQKYCSGMVIERISENKFLYHCNDVGIETNFNELVFEITLS